MLSNVFVVPMAAQTPVPAAVAPCSYDACALSIAPRWNGLAVVRGSRETQLANLNFFLPRDISGAFHMEGAAVSAAIAEARRAVRVRRVAAALTDGGLVLLAAGAVRALSERRLDDTGTALVGAGAVAFAVSVPLQFAADGALSRAVWLHNRHFAH